MATPSERKFLPSALFAVEMVCGSSDCGQSVMERGECRRLSLCHHWKRICAVTCQKIADASEGRRRLGRWPTPQKIDDASENLSMPRGDLGAAGPDTLIISTGKIVVGMGKFVVGTGRIAVARKEGRDCCLPICLMWVPAGSCGERCPDLCWYRLPSLQQPSSSCWGQPSWKTGVTSHLSLPSALAWMCAVRD